MLRSTLKSLARLNGLHGWSGTRAHLHSLRSQLGQLKVSSPSASQSSSFMSMTGPGPVPVAFISSESKSNRNQSHYFNAQRSGTSPETLDQSLHRLDIEIRRTGRINRKEIEELLEDVREMKSITSNQSLMILRCCGELIPEETHENRTKLVLEVWKTMEKLKVPLDISHYNALLRVYLENEHKFNPTEFLQQLTSKGLEPNRVTYQRLIARFCQDGDIEGASTILQHMKEKQLPINIHVFNALVLGHAQANDMESAEGIIGVMKQAGLEANDDTYAMLMRGYAKKGDIDNIKRIIQQCEEKEIHILDRDFLEVIYTLAASKHEQLVGEILPLLKKHAGFNQDVTNVIFRLINIGQEDVAFQLLTQMPRPMRADELAPSGTFFIRQMVASSTPSEKILKFCHQMISTGLNKYALIRACEFALVSRQFDKAYDFLEVLKESGFPIRQHYFWPFFASSKTEKDVYDGLRCMKDLDMSPTIESLREYILPALLNNSESKLTFDVVLEKLSVYTGISMSFISPAALQYVLQKGQLEQAAKFALKYRVNLNHPSIRRILIEAYSQSHDANSIVKILGSTAIDGEDTARETVGLVLMDLLDYTRTSQRESLLLPILKECLVNGLGISNSALEWIQNKLGDGLTPDITNILIQLTSGDLSPKSSLYTPPGKDTPPDHMLGSQYTIEELEEILKSSGSLPRANRGLKKALLIQYCRGGHAEKAEALYNELKAENFLFTPGINALMMDAYCQANNLEKAKEMHAQIESKDFFTLDDLKILKFALALVSNGETEECIQFLKNQTRDESRSARGGQQVSFVWKILNTLAEKGEVEKVKEVFGILKDRGLTPVNNVVLGPLVKAYIARDDMEGALQEFENCVNNYSSTPYKNELFCRFIKAEDADRLQKVMDLSTKQHGEVNSLYDLIFAFLECGKIRQAKKILETPGFRARNDKLDITCEMYAKENRVEELEKLIEVTRDLYNIDRNSMYFHLLKAHCNNNDAEKALSVWTSLQEENIQPSTDLLIYLANFLRKNNLSVPFVVPADSEVSSTTQEKSKQEKPKLEKSATTVTKSAPVVSDPLTVSIKEFRKLVEVNELDKAMELKTKIESEGKFLPHYDLSHLILKLTNAERLEDAKRMSIKMFDSGFSPSGNSLRVLFNKLVIAGDVDSFKQFEPFMDERLKRAVMFNSRFCMAHVEAGRALEYYNDNMKKEIKLLESGERSKESVVFPISGAMYILNRHAELLPEFEELAEKALAHGFKTPYNALWMFHLMNKNTEKARDIWNTQLKDESQPLFRSVLTEGKNNKDEDILNELASQVLSRESISKSTKGLVVSDQINVLCANGKPESALDLLNKCLDGTVLLENIHRLTLVTLKNNLEAKNINFPHEIPENQERSKRKLKADDSSSSDSSDSEKESR